MEKVWRGSLHIFRSGHCSVYTIH